MYIIFLKKKHLLWAALVIVLLVSILLVVSYSNSNVNAPTINPIYIGNTQEQVLCFTINVDWGEDVIPGMMEVLKKKNIKATFFVTGRFAKKFPQTVQAIAAAGHEIGNHGYSHPHPDKISVEHNKQEITQTEEVLTSLGIKVSKLFAPPYGEHKPHVVQSAQDLGYKTIMWTVDTVDWQEPHPDVIVQRVVSKADKGTIVLMHPKKQTLSALPTIIETLTEKGFQFRTVTEIIMVK